MLNQLGGINVGADDWRFKRFVYLFHRLDGALRTHADDDTVRFHEILDSEAFAQKFRIAYDVDFDFGLAVALDRLGHFVAGLYRHGAFIDHYLIAGHALRDFARNRFHETEVYRAIGLRRRRHRNKDDVRFLHAFAGRTGKAQPAGGGIALDEVFQARLINRHATGLKQLHLGNVFIDANHLMAYFGKACARYQPHVARPNDRQLHAIILSKERTIAK